LSRLGIANTRLLRPADAERMLVLLASCAPFALQRRESNTLLLLYIVIAGRYSMQFVTTTRAQTAHAAVPQNGCLIFLRCARDATRQIEHTIALVFCLYTGLYSIHNCHNSGTAVTRRRPADVERLVVLLALHSRCNVANRIHSRVCMLSIYLSISIFHAVVSCHDSDIAGTRRGRLTERLLVLLALRSRCNAAN